MTGNMNIAILLTLLITKDVLGDMITSILNWKDPCTNLCENIPIGFPNNMYIKSCCERGCRFFNLVDLRFRWEQNSLNGTKNACEALCAEAYTSLNDRYVCNTGCNFMAKQQLSDLSSVFTVAYVPVYCRLCMKENIDALTVSPDIPENDILTDPGLRKELLPRWWDSDGFKLPQTLVKTIPIGAKTADYVFSSDFTLGEFTQPASTSKSESSQYQIEQAISVLSFVFQRLDWMIFAPIIIGITLVYFMWKTELLDKTATYRNINSSSDIALFIPDEAVMYKVPPPKYTMKYNESSQSV